VPKGHDWAFIFLSPLILIAAAENYPEIRRNNKKEVKKICEKKIGVVFLSLELNGSPKKKKNAKIF